jgi:hypothetical protein
MKESFNPTNITTQTSTHEQSAAPAQTDNGFCQLPSGQNIKWLEEAQGDPRVVAGLHPGAEWRTPYLEAPGHPGAFINAVTAPVVITPEMVDIPAQTIIIEEVIPETPANIAEPKKRDRTSSGMGESTYGGFRRGWIRQTEQEIHERKEQLHAIDKDRQEAKVKLSPEEHVIFDANLLKRRKDLSSQQTTARNQLRHFKVKHKKSRSFFP